MIQLFHTLILPKACKYIRHKRTSMQMFIEALF